MSGEIRATNGVATWPIARLNTGWCFLYGVMAERDYAASGELIDHYDSANPCPGPHGELYAATPPTEGPGE